MYYIMNQCTNKQKERTQANEGAARLVTSRYLSNSDVHLKVTAGSNESLLVRSRFVTSDLAKIRRNLHTWCMPPSLVRPYFRYQTSCHPRQQTCHVQPQLQRGVRHDDAENRLFPTHQVSLLLVCRSSSSGSRATEPVSPLLTVCVS